MSEIVATGSQAPGPAVPAGRGTPRNQTATSGNAFASLLQGLSAAEPLPNDAAKLSDASTQDPVVPDKDADPAMTDLGAVAPMAWPDLMQMQRTLAQAVDARPAAGPGRSDQAVLPGGASLQLTPLDGAGAVPASSAHSQPTSGTPLGSPPARTRMADGSASPGSDAPVALQAPDSSPAIRGEAKFRAPEAPAPSSALPPAAGRVDPAHARDLSAPDFRLSMRSLPPEAEAAAIQLTDSRGPDQERPQRQDGSGPDDGRGREGSAAGSIADRQAPVDEAGPAGGVLPEDYAAAAQTATDGMAYWSTNGVHTGEIHLQDGQQEPMSIRVRVSGEEAQVSFAADHAAMREQLASSADQLQALLGESGIRLTDVSVGTSGGQPQPQPQPEAGSRPKDSQARGAALEPLVAQQPPPPRRSTGRLDIFA